MNYCIVYKTDEYRDLVIENLKCFGKFDNIHLDKCSHSHNIYQQGNHYRFIKFSNINDNERGQKYHHIILEEGAFDLLTNEQVHLLKTSDSSRYIFERSRLLIEDRLFRMMSEKSS